MRFRAPLPALRQTQETASLQQELADGRVASAALQQQHAQTMAALQQQHAQTVAALHRQLAALNDAAAVL